MTATIHRLPCPGEFVCQGEGCGERFLEDLKFVVDGREYCEDCAWIVGEELEKRDEAMSSEQHGPLWEVEKWH